MSRVLRILLYSSLFISLNGCSVFHQAEDALAHKDQYISPYFFIYHPASLQLKNGDSVNAHFTNDNGIFYQHHENADSNTRSARTRYPVTNYYKKYEAAEVNSYTTGGLRFEAVMPASGGIGETGCGNDENILYMERLSPDSSRILLYRYFLDYDYDTSLHHDLVSYTIRMVARPPDTVFPNRSFFYIYYVHLPGQPRQQVFNLYYTSNPQREAFIELLKTCPAMQPELERILAAPKNNNLVQLMLDKEDYTHSRIVPRLLELFRRYDACPNRR